MYDMGKFTYPLIGLIDLEPDIMQCVLLELMQLNSLQHEAVFFAYDDQYHNIIVRAGANLSTEQLAKLFTVVNAIIEQCKG